MWLNLHVAPDSGNQSKTSTAARTAIGPLLLPVLAARLDSAWLPNMLMTLHSGTTLTARLLATFRMKMSMMTPTLGRRTQMVAGVSATKVITVRLGAITSP